VKLTDPVKSIKLHAQRIPGYLSNTVSTLGDTPGHELAHRVFSLHITSDDSDFDGFNTVNYVQADEVDGTGSFWGYALWPLVNGDSVYIKFKSCTQKSANDDGAWKIEFQGELTFIKGSGKYQNISGTFPYSGITNIDGSFWDAVIEI